VDLSKYVELFLSEGREHVAEMNAALLVLERVDRSADEQSAAIAAIFRAVHTIKGMAAAMHYTEVADRSHALETMLDGVRRGSTPLTAALVAHLYEETDALARAIETAVTAVGDQAGGEGDTAPDADGTAADDTDASATKTSSRRRGRRGEFLSRHVRVDASRLDALMDTAGELEIARLRLQQLASGRDPEALSTAVAHMSRLVSEIRDQVMTVRMVPVGHVFERFPGLVRDTARSVGKDIEFVIDGKDIELDRSTLDALGDPVVHLLRNAIDHGLETAAEREAAGKAPRGRLTLSAQRETNYVVIRVADDGRGIDRDAVLARAHAAGLLDAEVTSLNDRELLDVLVQSGFSTASQVTELSGRGVGLDAVDAAVRALGGTLDLRSVARFGTVITLRLPLTVSVIRALLARLGNETVAIPITNVIETIELDPSVTAEQQGRVRTTIRDDVFTVIQLRETVGLPTRTAAYPKAVTVDVRGRRAALVVDDFVGQQDVVVKPFDGARLEADASASAVRAAAMFSGATILSDGAPALIVDVNSLV
jgi:two-component system chemotaxis sensor kinase CheA